MKQKVAWLAKGPDLNTDFSELINLVGVPTLLLCDKPYGKARFVSKMITEALRKGGTIYYIDLDVSFSAYLQGGLLDVPNPERLLLFNPTNLTMDEVISYICATFSRGSETIVFDSASTLYHIFAGQQSAAEINHRLGLYLALLQGRISQCNGTLLVTSMIRAKKVGGSSWVQSYPGGRVLMTRGKVIYNIWQINHHLDVKILKHINQSLEGRLMRLPL